MGEWFVPHLFDDTRLSIPESEWSKSEDAKAAVAEKVFEHYRRAGFPFQRKLSRKQRMHQIALVRSAALDGMEPDGSLKRIFHGLSLCWGYFPHAPGVPCSGKMTSIEAFNSDKTFRRAIERCMARYSVINDGTMRRTIACIGEVQAASNFRPVSAAAIYRGAARLLGRQDLVAWDMCSGFGGRLLGSLCCDVIRQYYGTDPSTPTHRGLIEMATDIGSNAIIERLPAEDYEVPEPCDVCFTSPPYFNTEVYSDDPEQSCHRYSQYELWINGFLRATMRRCAKCLKPDGLMLINVGRGRKCPTLERDTISSAQAEGFAHTDTWHYLIPAMTVGGVRSEPVFLFRRP